MAGLEHRTQTQPVTIFCRWFTDTGPCGHIREQHPSGSSYGIPHELPTIGLFCSVLFPFEMQGRRFWLPYAILSAQ